MSVRTYTELISLPTFEERFRYLKLDGKIGEATFGFQRWLNQEFYHSSEWLSFRDDVIIRDNGIGMEDVEKSMEPAYSTVEDRMGLGFVFMKSFMDEFTVISTPGCGTTLLMRKQPQKCL